MSELTTSPGMLTDADEAQVKAMDWMLSRVYGPKQEAFALDRIIEDIERMPEEEEPERWDGME